MTFTVLRRFVLSALVTATAGLACAAGSQAASSGVVHACISPVDDFEVHIVTGHQACPLPQSTRISWNERGQRGERGLRGLTGKTGAVGAAGPPGPKGDAGPQGTQGIQGDTGATGSQGPQGLTGPQGPVGPQGATGPQGLRGLTGATGAQGPQGPAGATGPPGSPGASGYEVVTATKTMSSVVGATSQDFVDATCPNGKHLIGGGGSAGSQEADMTASGPLLSGGQTFDIWDVEFIVTSTDAQGDSFPINAFAYCANTG